MTSRRFVAAHRLAERPGRICRWASGPGLFRQARASGVVRHVGPGANVWSDVHLDDVCDLYLRALDAAPAGSFYFVENGEASFADIAGAIADALGLGAPEPWSVEEAIAEWGV